ncbi:MAG: folylpolyglutamate synthase/dihydrofolate synthase family protein [Ignavibacteriaceae bacterium]
MTIEQGLEKLYSLHTFGIKLGLDNILNFLEVLGNPQLKLKTFHVAGSNGKGSTSAFVSSILREFKYKVGLYTSPHFVRFNERIKINNSEIPDSYVAEFISNYEKYIDEMQLTFFEVTTAMAFKYFQEHNIDYAVIETGLGGRLDATNVLNPCAVIITSISMEHTAILGDTIKKIASEKAGVIKNGGKVFTGILPDEADSVIEEKCKETSCELFRLNEYINKKHGSIELYTEEIELDDWTMPLRGDYQKFNAALAGLAVSKVLDVTDFNSIHTGIKNVIKNTGIQGRYEYFHIEPDIIFDSAHNPESTSHFISEFRKDYKKYEKRILLFGAMRDKAIKEMLASAAEYFDEIYVTKVNNERSCSIEELEKTAKEININVKPEERPAGLVTRVIEGNKNNCLVVLGSMYLVGEIKTSLQNDKLA